MPKCADCGLVGWYHIDTRSFQEIDLLSREGVERKSHTPYPICSVNAHDLRKEAHKENPIRGVLCNERDCSKFFKWQVGFSPKEHQEMVRQEFLESMRIEQRERDMQFQENIRKQDQQWQFEQIARTERFHTEMKERELAFQKFWDRIIQVLLVIVGVSLTAVATVILFQLGFKQSP